MKMYIDFDGTLFDSTIQYERLLNIFKKYNIEKDYIEELKKEDFYQKEKSYDVLAEKIISNKNLDPNILKEVEGIYTEDLVYPDVVPFLKKYSSKFELILLTLGNVKHQEKKIKVSKLSKYFKDIIIAEKDKSKIDIDYTSSIFIDNNPIELERFHNSKAGYLIRIKRDIDKYSLLPLTVDNVPEFANFDELTKSNYLDKIGDNYE